KELYKTQKKISKENLKNFKGKTVAVTVDGFDDDSLLWYGRAYFNAPDIDGKVYFTIDSETKSGDKVNVKILKTGDYDLFGTAGHNCRK
ncbi:MAG: 30S ribosomal protein S12 methylthiotransferase RimO, partial [Clostridia bacterium]|nr:30S ribosomal protein S12 methylthiotransferase RimO [Clostridia bacterium]